MGELPGASVQSMALTPADPLCRWVRLLGDRDSHLWPDVLRIIRRVVINECGRRNTTYLDSEDIAQDVAVRFLTSLEGDRCGGLPATASFGAWIRGMARMVVRERIRSIRPDRCPPPALAGAGRVPEDSSVPDRVIAGEYLHGECGVKRLPPPFRQVALMQAHGHSRREVEAFLCRWRPVGREACRKILRQTHEMLRALGQGHDPMSRWPRRFTGRNRWLGTPPPPLPS